MDASTAAFYTRYAANLAAGTEAPRSAMMPHVERALRPGASVLDVGAGSGRDVAAMIAGGFDAFGVEPCDALREAALQRQPALRGRLEPALLPRLGRPFLARFPQGFDAVVCSAVLMHVEPGELAPALDALAAQLRAPRPGDPEAACPALLLSLPHMEPSRLAGHVDPDGRRFHNHDAARVREHLGAAGLVSTQSIVSDAVLAATATRWITMVFRRLDDERREGRHCNRRA